MMNNKIQELAEHCDFYIGNEHHDKSHEEQQRLFMEKFAELIVWECCKICDTIGREARQQWKAKYHPHDDGRSDGAWECEEQIKEYFGWRD